MSAELLTQEEYWAASEEDREAARILSLVEVLADRRKAKKVFSSSSADPKRAAERKRTQIALRKQKIVELNKPRVRQSHSGTVFLHGKSGFMRKCVPPTKELNMVVVRGKVFVVTSGSTLLTSKKSGCTLSQRKAVGLFHRTNSLNAKSKAAAVQTTNSAWLRKNQVDAYSERIVSNLGKVHSNIKSHPILK